MLAVLLLNVGRRQVADDEVRALPGRRRLARTTNGNVSGPAETQVTF